MSTLFDDIVAPITGVHPVPVALVRISGEGACDVAARVFRPWPNPIEPRRAYFGRYAHGDEGFATYFEAGRSYTGEPCVELSLHGSPISVRALIEACISAGAREARPGEFTERAFLNGRMDLTKAEGVRDTVAALTDLQLRNARELRRGTLQQRVSLLREHLIRITLEVEARTDFSEEIGELDDLECAVEVDAAIQRINQLLETARIGRMLAQGVKIVLVGLPNAGKSSLMNALLGFERAIVTPIPGTTRDMLDAMLDLGGVPCRLVDTAGLRDSNDEVERLGVKRALEEAGDADLVWYLFDLSKGWTEEDQRFMEVIPEKPWIIGTKSDLGGEGEALIRVSALNGEGLGRLGEMVQEQIGAATCRAPVIVNPRHAVLLEEARDALQDAASIFLSGFPPDVAVSPMRVAITALGQITGETTSPDMVERLFQDFCIGK